MLLACYLTVSFSPRTVYRVASWIRLGTGGLAAGEAVPGIFSRAHTPRAEEPPEKQLRGMVQYEGYVVPLLVSPYVPAYPNYALIPLCVYVYGMFTPRHLPPPSPPLDRTSSRRPPMPPSCTTEETTVAAV